MSGNKDQEEYLKKFLNDSEEIKKEVTEIKEEIKYNSSNNTLEYLSVDLKMLPHGTFYQNGFKIKIRAAKVHEVQAYSIVDDKNILDVTEKMNQLLFNCVNVILPNGKNGSYKDIKDGDRLFLIFMIRELTFQKGNSLAKEVSCKKCNHEFSIPFRATANAEYPKTFEFYDMDEKLKKYFNNTLKCFIFNSDDKEYKIAPPTIGIQEISYNEIKNKVQSDKNPNLSFLKIAPYLLWDRTDISEDGLKEKEKEFKNLDMYSFQIINQAIDKMKFGLKGLKMKCPQCGQEVHTDMSFPNGASSLFIVSTIFD